jgi:hypothetical protein
VELSNESTTERVRTSGNPCRIRFSENNQIINDTKVEDFSHISKVIQIFFRKNENLFELKQVMVRQHKNTDYDLIHKQIKPHHKTLFCFV